MILNIIWFVLLFVLLSGYVILDGFDLGVGIIHLFSRTRQEREVNVHAIGPFWDGNEVWLLTAGGSLFAAFPPVYATVFSSFYLAFMLLLVALIARAVGLEFRHKVSSPRWERFWDWVFGVGSLVPALLYGVALGNILRGLPLNEDKVFTGSFFGLLNPYALLTGGLSLAVIILHGAAWLQVKTVGEIQQRMKKWVSGAWVTIVILFIIVTIATFFVSPFILEGILAKPLYWVALVLVLAGLIFIPVANQAGRGGLVFLASCMMIAGMLSLAAFSLFPRLVPALGNLNYSLTIFNGSSTQKTLWVMLVIALIGMPVVIGYTAFIYYIFRGKVTAGEEY
ncbi:MAG: cytochrome d ubiquinol oxidase subunit II [Sedimentisphaerales bacterium]|nr:cytochrome d ubiquinol oxidase subunit II [Sedimentisphaerales bacterium]